MALTVGDDVLVHLATVLRGRVRADGAVVSRLGGDELAVLLRGRPAEVAVRRAGQLLHAVRSTPRRWRTARSCRCRSASLWRTCPAPPPTCAVSTQRGRGALRRRAGRPRPRGRGLTGADVAGAGDAAPGPMDGCTDPGRAVG
ncbi:hypothetical protein DQ238_11485 [Geodermatophilus sp. TF02-6]|nr:hypothetical protein DQ238_11485 [Geodermatophilus sp. TF02-6]